MSHIPDPTEIMESNIERMMDRFVDMNTCMVCGARQEHECSPYSMNPDSPLACDKCCGFTEQEQP